MVESGRAAAGPRGWSGELPAELVVATGNEHKLLELRRLFPGITLRTPAQVGVRFEFEENGAGYLDNAMGKARHLYALVGRPVLADDSGLEVTGLGGRPGVYSSRYGSAPGGAKLSDAERNALLLQEARGLEERSCRFVCCMVLVVGEARFVAAQETCEGVLARGPSGAGGFGYDPVVYLPELGRSVAELSDVEKDRVSHRGRAARRVLALLGPAGPPEG
ncbi:MAG: non-canonical purine NTP pyrophosphatase [Spirochaetales bacterium]|nr:non-canonical purine NTP pyrophosphatase [Spirochaetales bacterium]